jgi:hypothetical protein
MASLAGQLEVATTARYVVKYLSAPAASGKTSSILPAFLRSTERDGGFTHYLYLSFDNNNFRFYRLAPDIEFADPENQGSSFILKCLKHLLEEQEVSEEGPFYIQPDEGPLNGRALEKEIVKYLEQIASPASRILLHLDEHRKMCPRERTDSDEKCPGALFSRGAMQSLARVPSVTVVATYTKQPPLPPLGSSGVCRYPVSLPCLDMETVMKEIPELNYPQDEFNREERRKWATLVFRLGMKLTQLGLTGLHKRSDPRVKQLLKDFNEKKRTKFALENCNALCKVALDRNINVNTNASKLLVGLPEKGLEDFERQVNHLVLVGSYFTSSLNELLTMSDPNVPVYSDGLIRFRRVLKGDDCLSDTPLEAAYTWVLSSCSALTGNLTFAHKAFKFSANHSLASRIFPGTDNTEYDKTFTDIKPDILYYAREGFGYPSHPLADIFFVTALKELVLVDVTGGNNSSVKVKSDRMNQWINSQQKDIHDHEVHGIILAPLASGNSHGSGVEVLCGKDAQKHLGPLASGNSHGSRVDVLCDKDAQEHLGGLAQVLRWFKD